MNKKQIEKELSTALVEFERVQDMYGLLYNEVKILMDKDGCKVDINEHIRGIDKWDDTPYDWENKNNANYKS